MPVAVGPAVLRPLAAAGADHLLGFELDRQLGQRAGALIQEVAVQIGGFIEEVYMYKRGHSSLGYLTPVEYEMQWRSLLQTEVADVI